jgi:tol-pal system protein YbgF
MPKKAAEAPKAYISSCAQRIAANTKQVAILSMQRHSRCSAVLTLLATLALAAPAGAEPQLQGAPDAEWQVAQAQQPPQADAPAAASPGPNLALQRRVEQLEEQLVDMQVIIGTLESLARGGNAAPSSAGGAPGGMSSAGDLRIDGLETQVRAMAAQIQQLTTEVRELASRRADAGPAAAPPGDDAGAQPPSRFGSTTVTAGTDDAIGGLIDSQIEEKPEPTPSQTVAATPPAFMPPSSSAADASNPKELYESAYGYLMQRDYGAAQSAFEEFLGRYPKDSLAGNAQYWLGEAHFVRGEYKAAAGAFLKGYQNYSGNARAADSLLKLAMSLDRLGQKDAACTSFAELNTRFPDAPDNVKSRASSERQRIGCN